MVEATAPWRPPTPGELWGTGAFRPTIAHGGGVYELRVLVDDPASFAAGPEFPRKTTICAEHRRASGGAAGPLACMRKRADGWRFAIALAPYATWLREGALEECAGCHATAPRDQVFGAP